MDEERNPASDFYITATIITGNTENIFMGKTSLTFSNAILGDFEVFFIFVG